MLSADFAHVVYNCLFFPRTFFIVAIIVVMVIIVTEVLGQAFIIWRSLALNSQSSYFSLPSARITVIQPKNMLQIANMFVEKPNILATYEKDNEGPSFLLVF